MIFEERLRALRITNGYTQISIADALGVDRSRYAKWEKGIARPSIEVIAQICALFKVSADYMLVITNDPAPRDDPADHDLAHKLAASPEATHVYAATEEELAAQLPEGIRDAVLALVNVAVESKIQAEKEQRDKER